MATGEPAGPRMRSHPIGRRGGGIPRCRIVESPVPRRREALGLDDRRSRLDLPDDVQGLTASIVLDRAQHNSMPAPLRERARRSTGWLEPVTSATTQRRSRTRTNRPTSGAWRAEGATTLTMPQRFRIGTSAVGRADAWAVVTPGARAGTETGIPPSPTPANSPCTTYAAGVTTETADRAS